MQVEGRRTPVPIIDFENPPNFPALVHGSLVEDPLSQAGGARPRFEPLRTTLPGLGEAALVRPWHLWEGMLLSIRFESRDGSRSDVLGSAVLVAPGVAICASHVLKDYWEQACRGEVACYCTGISSHGLQTWQLTSWSPVRDTDLTLLGMRYVAPLPPHRTFKLGFLTTRLPLEHERVVFCGFRPQKVEHIEQGVVVAGNVIAVPGVITAVYPRGRDRAVLSWPCIEASCPSVIGAMSGGPVFDHFGYLLGVVCSSFEQGPAYASLLWPALCQPILSYWPPDLQFNNPTLHSLREHCFILGREKFSSELQGDGTWAWQLKPWLTFGEPGGALASPDDDDPARLLGKCG